MSHKLEKLASGKGSAFFGGNLPFWHGLGTVIGEEAITFEDAVRYVPTLGMEVHERPLWVQLDDQGDEGVKVDWQKALVRSDGKVVGVVGNRYQPVQNSVAFDFLSSVVGKDGAILHTGGTLEDGRKAWLQVKLDRSAPAIAGIREEEHERYVTFMNSYDGSTKVGAIYGNMRVGCWNTYNAAIGSSKAAYWFRHTANVMERVGEAKRALGLAGSYFDAYDALATVAIRQPFSDRQFMGVLDDLIPLPSLTKRGFDSKDGGDRRREDNAERERDAVKLIWLDSPSISHCRGTAWAALNAWTEYVDHHTLSRATTKSNQAENRMKRILFDTSLKDAATERVLATAGIKL